MFPKEIKLTIITFFNQHHLFQLALVNYEWHSIVQPLLCKLKEWYFSHCYYFVVNYDYLYMSLCEFHLDEKVSNKISARFPSYQLANGYHDQYIQDEYRKQFLEILNKLIRPDMEKNDIIVIDTTYFGAYFHFDGTKIIAFADPIIGELPLDYYKFNPTILVPRMHIRADDSIEIPKFGCLVKYKNLSRRTDGPNGLVKIAKTSVG